MVENHYVTIARRFRPNKFNDVLGQDTLVETLKNALRNNTLSTAYIFSGTRGTGKTTLARILAKAIHCEHKVDQYEPCNECTNCKQISSSSSFEVIEIDGASNRGIDDIRNIHENIGIQTRNNASKIYIIDEVHMLTKEAFNALLKTLEEPASNTRFFFATTEIHKIPATIISRCQKFELLPIRTNLICSKLEKIATELNICVEKEACETIAKLSHGSLRDAESLLDQMISFSPKKVTAKTIFDALGLIKLDLFKKLDQAYAKQEPSKAFELAQEFFNSGIDPSLCLQQLLEHFRNITLFKTSQQHLLAFKTNEIIEIYTKASQTYPTQALYQLIAYLTHMQEKFMHIHFQQLHLEMLFLHILQTSKRVGIDTIIQKVQELSLNLEQNNETHNTTLINKEQTSTNTATLLKTKISESTSSSTTKAPAHNTQNPKTHTHKPTSSAEKKTSVQADPTPEKPNPAPLTPDVTEATSSIDKNKLTSDETVLQFASVELSAKLKKY